MDEGANFFRLQQTFAILRVVVFLGLAAFSQLLSIGWRNRELQVATGLGFYSIVSLAITILHTHQVVGPQYHWLDEVGAASYLSALAYWVLSFATKGTLPEPIRPGKPCVPVKGNLIQRLASCDPYRRRTQAA